MKVKQHFTVTKHPVGVCKVQKKKNNSIGRTRTTTKKPPAIPIPQFPVKQTSHLMEFSHGVRRVFDLRRGHRSYTAY